MSSEIRIGDRKWYMKMQKEVVKEIENARKFLDGTIKKRIGGERA